MSFLFPVVFSICQQVLIFSILPLFQSSMSSFHSLTVFLKLQLKDIVHKLTGLWTVALECSKLNQHVFGNGILVLSKPKERGAWMLSEALIWDLWATCPVRGTLNPDIRHWAIKNRDERPEAGRARSIRSPCCLGKPWPQSVHPLVWREDKGDF